jgi:hypothetical protein
MWRLPWCPGHCVLVVESEQNYAYLHFTPKTLTAAFNANLLQKVLPALEENRGRTSNQTFHSGTSQSTLDGINNVEKWHLCSHLNWCLEHWAAAALMTMYFFSQSHKRKYFHSKPPCSSTCSTSLHCHWWWFSKLKDFHFHFHLKCLFICDSATRISILNYIHYCFGDPR